MHGLARLKSDPGLAKLGQTIYKGRKAEQLLRLPPRPLDKLMPLSQNYQIDPSKVEELESDIANGKEAYHDYLVTSWHPRPSTDATAPEREPYEGVITHRHPYVHYIERCLQGGDQKKR